MNWPATALAIGMIIIGAAVNWAVMVAFFRYKKRPGETQVEILMREQHRQMYEEFKARHGINGHGKKQEA